ncbi:MAG TPA: hypothetical protein VFE90_00670 [Myxococcales bacterium]|jgi:hypothetical protein|nr:hypothetical protein [Myxococcales bacterium]
MSMVNLDRSARRLAAALLVFSAGVAAQSAAPPDSVNPEAAPAPAATAPAQPKWYSGRPYSWGSVGTTFAYGQTYGSANLGVGWLMRNGIAPNVELGYAFGGSPTMWSLRPGVTWYMPIAAVQPYVGAYYSHWFVGGAAPDQDGIGGRAGFSVGRVLSLGMTYDHALGCNQNCDSWSPQISAGYSF